MSGWTGNKKFRQTFRSVLPNMVFQSSSSIGFRSLYPWCCRGYLIL